MVPPLAHAGTLSVGERELFRRIKDDPATQDWIVLHSLDIARHSTQQAGEADFVVVVPGKGVLCLEIKAHRHVRRDRGLWFYGSQPKNPDARGPFKQSADAMHSLRNRVRNRDHSLARVVFWSGVIFTSVNFRVQSEEWHDWQVIDASSLRSRPISALIHAMLERARDHLVASGAGWFDPTTNEPTEEQCERLLQLLRPNFEMFESPRARLLASTAELKRYTAEQFIALDAMESNPRVIFDGPAGTGKTLLAIETARRAQSRGRKVLLLCYNRLLGVWLERETDALCPGVVASTFHKYMLTVIGNTLPPGDVAAEFWEAELPMRTIDELLANSAGAQFDEIVVDESQDLMRDQYLDVIDLILKGGLAAGRWRFFGDLEGQAIYGTSNDPLSGLLRRTGPVPRYGLRVNCRNTPRVAELVQTLGGLTPPYSRILRPDDGIEPEIRYYASPAAQSTVLTGILDALYGDGFRGKDLVILSSRAVSPCAAGIASPPWCDRLRPLSPTADASYGYCSIHAYKGLEAGAVIVTDVERLSGQDASMLLYVAATRATQRLYILANVRVKAEVRELVRRQLMRGRP